MTTGLVAIIALSVVAVLAMVTVLVAMGKDPSQIVTFLGTILVPSVIGLFTAHKADTAQDAAKKAERNTNGRMTELIALLTERGIPVPDGYDDVTGGRHAE